MTEKTKLTMDDFVSYDDWGQDIADEKDIINELKKEVLKLTMERDDALKRLDTLKKKLGE